MKHKRNPITFIAILMILIGVVLMNIKKNFLFQEYGYECVNVTNSVSSSFEIKEKTKVYFNFYCKAKGEMFVSIKDSYGNIIFFSDDGNFKKEFSETLSEGIYYYDIKYSGIDGDFELYAVERTLFGLHY